MSKAKIINLLVIIFMILGYASLFAQGSVLCSYCGNGTTSGKYYCTHCGTWWVSPDNIIKSEFGLGASYDKTDYKDLVFTDTNGTPTAEDLSTNDLIFQGHFKYHFNSRYQHPIVPFSFLPYNYRSNFIEGGVSDYEKNSFEEYYNVFLENHIESKSFWCNGEYHLNKIFIGGNLSFSNGKTDLQDTDNWSDRAMTIGGIGGYYNSNAKLGVEIQYHDYQEEHDVWEYNYQNIEIRPFVEYLPIPTLMLSGGIDYIYRVGQNDFYEYLIPVQLKLVTIDNWWEFEVLLTYNKKYHTDDRQGISIEIEKLFRNYSVFIRPQLFHYTSKDTHISLLAGGNKAFMKRKLLVTVSGYYGSGQDIDTFRFEASEFGGNISLKAYF